MTVFNLTDNEISRLTAKFREFQDTRNTLLIFIINYIADYQQSHGTPSNHRRYLRQKYTWQTPRINYLFNSGDGFYWSIRNIAIVLGRNRSSITRTMKKMKASEYWNNRLSGLRRIVISENGLNIVVFHQDIFELLLDYYEEEYLMRFAKPRHGSLENAPDIDELRRFWYQLRAQENIQKRLFAPESFRVRLPVGWHYRFRKIMRKIFDFIKIKFIG